MSQAWPGSEIALPTLHLSDETKINAVLSQTDQFNISYENAIKMKSVFDDEMKNSLTSDQHVKRNSCLLNELTFLTQLPSGEETGKFLAIDLGSTNFRVILSDLRGGKGEDEFHVKYYDVPHNLRYGPHCKCINDFIKCTPSVGNAKVPLGFSFSYPMIQKSVDSGFLVTWTKSYDLPDAINKDAVDLLRQSIKEKNVNCQVSAIINDSTGTLLKGAYLDHDCQVGMIFGSGFNCAYVESVAAITKLAPEEKATLKDATHVALDIECGAFGDNGCIDFIKNTIDREVDADSLFTNSFSFEKMFAGNFFGDVVRRVLCKIVQNGALLGGKVTQQLTTKDSIAAADCVEIEKTGTSAIKSLCSKLGYTEGDISQDDLNIIDFVTKVVSIRAATLPSVLISALIDRINRPRTVIAIDGSLYKYHPKIHDFMMDRIACLSPGKNFNVILAEDGSGKGAGLAAATISLMANNNNNYTINNNNNNSKF